MARTAEGTTTENVLRIDNVSVRAYTYSFSAAGQDVRASLNGVEVEPDKFRVTPAFGGIGGTLEFLTEGEVVNPVVLVAASLLRIWRDTVVERDTDFGQGGYASSAAVDAFAGTTTRALEELAEQTESHRVVIEGGGDAGFVDGRVRGLVRAPALADSDARWDYDKLPTDILRQGAEGDDDDTVNRLIDNHQAIRALQATDDAIRRDTTLADVTIDIDTRNAWFLVPGPGRVPSSRNARLLKVQVMPESEDPANTRIPVTELDAQPHQVPGTARGVAGIEFTNAGGPNNDDNRYWFSRNSGGQFLIASDTAGRVRVVVIDDELDVTDHIRLAAPGTTGVDLAVVNGALQASERGTADDPQEAVLQTTNAPNTVTASATQGNTGAETPAVVTTPAITSEQAGLLLLVATLRVNVLGAGARGGGTIIRVKRLRGGVTAVVGYLRKNRVSGLQWGGSEQQVVVPIDAQEGDVYSFTLQANNSDFQASTDSSITLYRGVHRVSMPPANAVGDMVARSLVLPTSQAFDGGVVWRVEGSKRGTYGGQATDDLVFPLVPPTGVLGWWLEVQTDDTPVSRTFLPANLLRSARSTYLLPVGYIPGTDPVRTMQATLDYNANNGRVELALSRTTEVPANTRVYVYECLARAPNAEVNAELSALASVPAVAGYSDQDVVNAGGHLLRLTPPETRPGLIAGTAAASGAREGVNNVTGTANDYGAFDDPAYDGEWSWTETDAQLRLPKAAFTGAAPVNLWVEHVGEDGDTVEVAMVREASRDTTLLYAWQQAAGQGELPPTIAGEHFEATVYSDAGLTTEQSVHAVSRWVREGGSGGVAVLPASRELPDTTGAASGDLTVWDDTNQVWVRARFAEANGITWTYDATAQEWEVGLPSATRGQAGVIEIANRAEAQARQNEDLALTPGQFDAALDTVIPPSLRLPAAGASQDGYVPKWDQDAGSIRWAAETLRAPLTAAQVYAGLKESLVAGQGVRFSDDDANNERTISAGVPSGPRLPESPHRQDRFRLTAPENRVRDRTADYNEAQSTAIVVRWDFEDAPTVGVQYIVGYSAGHTTPALRDRVYLITAGGYTMPADMQVAFYRSGEPRRVFEVSNTPETAIGPHAYLVEGLTFADVSSTLSQFHYFLNAISATFAGGALYPAITIQPGDYTFVGGDNGQGGWIPTPGIVAVDRATVEALLAQLGDGSTLGVEWGRTEALPTSGATRGQTVWSDAAARWTKFTGDGAPTAQQVRVSGHFLEHLAQSWSDSFNGLWVISYIGEAEQGRAFLPLGLVMAPSSGAEFVRDVLLPIKETSEARRGGGNSDSKFLTLRYRIRANGLNSLELLWLGDNPDANTTIRVYEAVARGLRGPQGDKGDTGDTGPQGTYQFLSQSQYDALPNKATSGLVFVRS